MTAKQLLATKRQLMGLLVFLTIAYILGVILTTVVSYDPSEYSSVQSAFLIAHIVVAIGVLVGALVRFVLSMRWKSMRMLSTVGLVSVIGCFASGAKAASNGSNIAVLLMALFFIVTAIAYGICLLQLRERPSANNL